MAEAISDTAEFGGYGVEAEMMEAVGPVMDQVVADVVSGDFARRWLEEHESGRKALTAYRARAKADPLEAAGAPLRAAPLRKQK
jgi:ketol-acid reductoisomerase